MSSGSGKLTLYVNNAPVGSVTFSGQIKKPAAENNSSGSGSYDEPTVMAMGCNPKGNRAQTEYKDGCFTAMNLYNLKIYNQTGCVASYEATRNIGALKDLTGHNDGNVKAEDWTNKYIQLDGKDDWINLGQMSFRTNQVTLDLTMMILSTPSKNTTLIGNLETSGVALGITPELKPTMQINIDEKTSYKAVSSTAIELNKKVHVMGVYDGANVMIFVNGQLTGKMAYTGTIKAPNNATVMSIGSNPSGSSAGIEFTNMRVYTAHIYNKAYWDVSANGDNSILAWSVNSNSSGAKKVYIASKGNIYANANASYMFSNIGASSNCTATTVITNLNLLKTANTTNMYSMFWKTGYNAMTSLDLGTSFSTAKATNLEYMFQECGYKAMTSLNLRGINTSTATSMYAMFDGTGYTAMTSLNLGANFSTANVTKMTRMFKNCGYTKMTTLTLGSKFNTAKVTEMISMFEGTGYKVMTSLNLEGSFDTSKVTNMQAMFKNCGYTAMTTLTLGSKFNTAKVTNMQEMFANTGYTKMTKLDLGDIFYTTVATNMTSMFNATGYIAMGELDLGPAFTKIAGTYSNVFTNTGKSGCIIHAAEAIYQNSTTFKLNTSSGTTISYTRGSLNLRYKTEWIVESKNANTSAKNVTIQLRGRTNNNATSVYKSNVTSKLTKDNITVYINGAEASSISKSLGTVTTSKNPTTGYNDVLVTLTLSGFEQSALQSGKNYKEWSGDISIQIAQGTLKDSYGNKNTGLNSSGARVRESLAGPFADFIAPNVAYKFADSNIDKTNKRFTMVFDIVDKYYNASTSKTLAVTDLTIKIDGAVPDWNKVTRNLTSADLSNTVNGASKVVGKRYTLTLSNLQQSTIASGASYKDYSGVITVVVPEKKVYDTSGRYNPTTTITSGVNIPTNSGTGKVVDVVDPFWQVSNVNINHSTNQVTMTIKGTDKYYNGNSLTKDKITVLVDGQTATSVTKTLSSATSITKGVQYTLTLTTWQESSKQSGKSYLEWSGNTTIRIAAGTLTDSNGNSSKQQDFSIGLVDFIKPTITKVSATKDATNKRETIVFDVDDKYINTTSISTDNIKVYMNGVEATSITKSLSRTAKTGTVNGASKTVGYRYTLVLTNFEQSTYQSNKEYKEWSGTVSIKILAKATKDTSNNENVDTTITGDFVDFIKPQWRLVGSPTIDHTNNRVVMTIKGTDKYFKATTLATSNIKVYVDGTEVTSVTKSLSTATDVKEGSTKVGVQYTLTLTGWEQSSKQNGKSYFEWSGNTVVTIAAGVLTDTSSNSSPETSFTIGQVDFIKPKIEKVSSSKSGGTETITFKVIDKYFNTSAKLTKDDITVLVDSETASSVSKTLSNPTEIKETVNGASKVIGHQYTMTLTNFEKTRTTIDRNREYSDWSGTVAIKVAAGKVKDTSNNTNAETTITGDFLDVIKPNVTYQFSESNIDKNGKRFTMVFDITDKYYNASTSTTLSVNDLTIKIDGAVPDWNKVTRNLTVADYSNTVYYTSNGAIKHESKVIGKRYTLTLSNLQQSSIAANASYKDYSGVVTVAIPANKVADTTGNKNNAVTITSGVNIPTNSGTGKVVDVVDPYWQVSNININHNTNQVTMTIKGTDKYYNGNSLTKDKITVLVDGQTATSVTKTLSSATSITKGVQYTLTLTTWQESSKQSGKSYLEWSGNTTIRIAAGTLTDSNGNSSKQQDFSIGLVDFIKPTITKVSATKDATNKRETIVFDVDDKYINTTSISTDNIKVYMNGVEATSITKSLSRTAKTGTVNGASKTVGYRYTLVLTNFEQSTYQSNKEYKEWSGTVSIKILAKATKDTSNNENVDTTITGDFVDFIKPQWRLVGSPTIDHTNNRVVMTIKGTDKYFKATTLATSNIKVYVDGTEVTSVTKSLSTATDVKEGSTKVGVQYTLTLTGWEQSSKQNGKSYFEWSGNTVVTIAAGVLTDTSSNSSPETSFTIGQVDFIKPKIEKVSSSKSGGTETITFKVIDKYFNTSAKLTKDDITVLVDSETASSVSKTLSNPTEIKETVNGASKVIGHQYTMTLTNFEKTRTTIDRNREYSDWSGTVAIKVAAGKVKDTSNNTNAETTITGDFLDVIKPNVTYQFSESNIDKNGKRFTMVFDITDKYYNASTSTTLSVNDLTIKIDGAVPDWNKVTRNLTVADYSNTVYYTSNGAIKHESKVIGKRYTLTLSNLQQSSIAANASYKDYSGVVTVAIPANKVADTTGNKNNAVTITSGVNIPTNSGTGKVVDVVDPYWQVSNININHNTNQVTMTIKGTDKYYKASTLSRDNITVLVDGETATSVTKTLSTATSITNGVQYTLTLTTWQQSSKQSGKSYLEWSGNTVIRIAAGTMTDTNGNSSKQQDFSIGLVDFIKPVIEKVSSTKGTNNETIVFDVNDKYISTKLSKNNITTLINGETADVTTTITSISDIKGTGIHSSKTVGHRYTVVVSNFNKGRKNGRKYSDWSGTVSLRIAADAVQDTSQNKNNATTITGDFVDFIKPEITYIYSSGNIDHTNKTLTVDFTVADRYFSTSTVTTDEIKKKIKVKLKENDKEIPNLTGKINITKLSDYSDGSRGKVGENYRLTIGGLQQNTETDGLRDYSGPMSITFPADMVKDTEKKGNDAKTITIGVNDPGTGSQQVVDVVSPVWSVASTDVNGATVKIRVKDKYLLKTGTANTAALQLTTSEIAVLVNGTESTQVTKTITSGPTLVASGSNGYDTTYEYTIKLGNIAQTATNYIEFTPKETVVGGKAKYRDENGGSITLRIKAGAVQDAFTNTSAQQDLYIGNVDNTGPEVYDIQKTIAANGDETFVFNITDKNYDSSKIVSLSELNITIDGAQFSSAVQKNLTSQTLTDSATNKVLGHQYTLKLTNMKESNSSFMSALTSTTNRRVYREYSGTIRIVINSNAARDLKGNTLNTSTTTITSFNDKLAPEVVYIWSNSVINKNSKTFTMIFDITDKYYSSASLAIGDLTIKIGGKTPNWSSNEVGRSLSVSDIPNAAGKGKRYTLTLSNLQKLQIKSGDKYLDYSGVVTVAIPANKVKDTSGQGNVATTLTSGITIPGGTGSQEVVDVVEPYVQKMSSTVNAPAKTASITVRISDRYFNTSTLTKDTIEVYINGTKNSAVKTGWSTSEENESRTEKGTTSTVHVATNYTLNMSGFDSNINQIKVVVPANVVKDTSGNGNKQTEYIIYNVLRSAVSEDSKTSAFLGNSNIQRQNVDSVTFVNNIPSTIYDKSAKKILNTTTTWDVSAQQDKSILAWYTTSNGVYKVNIGSDSSMFGNIDSSFLFYYVGFSDKCTATDTIVNLNLLNVSNVTNMHGMFWMTGWRSMTKLDLGSNFDTSNVTNMATMFGETGKQAMTTLSLGSKFNTSKVTNMSYMFSQTGYMKLTALNLGSLFDTSNVTNMNNMFSATGYTAMTSLSLGSKFNTAKVTNMESMFLNCGFTALTGLDLGGLFDTSKVTTMKNMFQNCGHKVMATLNLGSKFNTANVTTMENMFCQAGRYKLTSLNLGSQFNTSKVTNMANMFNWMQALNSLSLGANFDTSNVTNMAGMFWGTGYSNMTSFNLGSKFNTKKVTNMNSMFYDFAVTKLTSLDLGDQFYTTNVTDMTKMFYQAGITSMTLIDLGPAFTKIAGTYTDMFTNTGKSGACVIYAPESIYQDKNNFKLNTSSGTKINYTKGTINARYRTEWIKESVTVDEANKKVMITIRGRTNPDAGTTYVSNLTSSLAAGNIRVYINGTEITNIGKSLGTATTVQNATTKANDVKQVLTLTNIEQGRVTGKEYKEYSGNISLEIAQGNLTDKYGNKNMAVTSAGARTGNTVADGTVQKNTSNTMFADMIKPEFTYVYADSDINHTDKTLTAIFKVADKYRASTAFPKKSDGTYDASTITVGIDSYDKTALNNAISKKLTLESQTTETISGQSRVTVQTYKLVIGNLEQKGQGGLSDGYTYSGILTLGFPEGTITDTSGHKSPATTITIGKNEPGGTGTGKPVDVVDPVWSVVSTNADTGVVKLRVKDKYLTKSTSKFNLAKESIKIIVNGVESTAIVKTLDGPTTITDGQEYEYTLTLSNIAPSGGGYTEFTPLETIVGGTAKYRNDNGGSITIRIPAGAVTDANGNKTKQQDLNVGNMDLTEPEVYFVQKNRDLANNQETIIFNVTDKNYDSTKLIAANELTTWVDGTQMDSKITKSISSKTISTRIDGSTRVVGHQYTLVLKGFAESDSAFASSGRVYREYSGNLQVKINKDAARDKRGNTLNSSTTTIAQFTDVVRPDIKAKWSDAVINKNNKTFTMIFDVTDKYYSTSTLAIENLTIEIGGKTPDWSSNGVGRSLSVSDIPGGVGKGKRYTLTLSNLQALQIKSGDKYLDYSGVVTVVVPAGRVKDTTGNTNLAKTITSGITIPGGTGSQEVVDVVEPYVQKMSSTVNAPAKTASITVRISDRYFNTSTLTKDTIEVYINGTKNSAVKTGWSTSEENESRTEKGTTSTVHVATNYTLNMSGFDSNINQIKVVVPANVVKDTSENGNKQTEYIIYNVLKSAATEAPATKEAEDTSVFLGNSAVLRKNIDNITFVSSVSGKNSTAWDVSAQGDSSILAWYTRNSNGSFRVYIGSDYEIFANTISANLFHYVGQSTICTSAETITNLNLLNVSSVTNMQSMFRHTGWNAMTKLDLGNNFDTRNVIRMSAMFGETGYNSMTTLNLGSNFNTANVVYMDWMFCNTGYKKMTSLNLGNNFDTSKVTNMQNMFSYCGYMAMTSLSLGSKFNTVKVENMQAMFSDTGYTALTSLDLGSLFDTSNVTKMNGMFKNAGYTAMTSLKLGSKFNTANVTTMENMFYQTGRQKLETLNLGSQFNTSKVTNMTGMFFWMGALKSLTLGNNFDTSNVEYMNGMFWGTGCYNMTSFSLGSKFNTNKVTNMKDMFYDFAHNITSLDLGDQFYTTSVTDMTRMFYQTGITAMTSIDLGPAFTNIASKNTDMFTSTGKSGSIVIHAPESIFQDKNNFKLNTSATTGTINWTRGTINPKYRTEWKKESATLDTTNKNIKITLRGTTNTAIAVDQYKSDVTSSLTKSNIKVYIDGVNATETLNKLNAISLGNATQTTENSRTGAKDVLQVVTLSNLEEAARQSGKSYKEWSGNIRLEIDQKTLTDTKYGNKNMAVTSAGARTVHSLSDTKVDKNTSNTMFVDHIKPEITYTYVDSDINHTNKTLTAEFILTDKYYSAAAFPIKNGKYDASSITVGIDSYDKTALNKAITKTLTKIEDVTDTVNGVANVKVGEKYRLVIGNLEQKGQDGMSDGYTYSGNMSLAFPEGTATDKSGNKSPAKTITIGKNEPGGTGSGKVVDVVDPVWEKGDVEAGTETGVVKLKVKDKYLVKADSTFALTKEQIKIIVNNKESTAIVKTLTGPIEKVKDQEYEYTLTLSNISPADAGYTEFTPKNPIVGGKAKYKNENGGNISLKIPAGAITDKYGNSTKEQIIDVGIFDGTGPAIYYVQKNRSIDANKETVIFNVTDKNYNSTDPITTAEMAVTIGGTTVDPKNLAITKAVEIITNVDGKTDVVVGHQYTLEISNIRETDQDFIKSGRKYRELSGELKIQINEDAARDLKGNTIDTDTTTINDYSDIVRPEVFYTYATTDINHTDKTFTMVFEMRDKYYDSAKSTTLTLNDLTIQIDGKVPDWTKVTRGFSVEDVSGTVDGKETTIGKRYTLTLSNLEQLQVKSGDKYLDYSGVITVAIPANKMIDKTTGNGNIAKTITSGVNILGGSTATDTRVVDVVDPLVTKISSTTNAPAKTATVKFKVTDKYFDSSTLTKDNIEVLVNGAVSNSVGKTLTSTNLTETRVENGKTSTVQYGIEYTLNITDFAADANQIKVRIPADKVKDKLVDGKQNGNKQTDIMVYNVLKKVDTDEPSGYIGEMTFLDNTAGIKRKDVDNITFVSNTSAKNSTAWDVSAQGDGSILAWYQKNSNGSYKIWIGSNYEIFANTDSRYWFGSIGYSSLCTSEETITNISLLNTSSVTYAWWMFGNTGYNAMTKLDLGDNFDTSNMWYMGAMFAHTGYNQMTTLNLGSKFNTSKVNNMEAMFAHTGYQKMESLSLGDKFNTANVTSMGNMFYKCGYTEMTSLNLGSNFDTSKVTNMLNMFQRCGYTAMISLDLGSNFDTSNVTDMTRMFSECGYTAMTSLNLGDKFNTSNVTNMKFMFARTGYEKLDRFSLGDKFDTSKVTSMDWMFSETGHTSMTSLNLGNKFNTSNVTTMRGMFNQTGRQRMSSLNLGNKFNTSKVTNMVHMFYQTGFSKMTSLDLGDQFYTTNVTNMMQMFESCGSSNMTSLDLGPAFTKIPSGTGKNFDDSETHEVYYRMFINTGKSGCVIHAPESIFQDKNNFKLNASATTGTVNYTKGTINPKYRTEWRKEKVVLDQANDNIKITLRGTTNTSVAENEYISDVTSSLALNKIKVLIDGTDITSTVLNAQGIGNATQTTENSRTGAKDVLQTITLTNFAKAAKRLDGKKYKEWSGNITIEIAQGTLSEKYGNKNMLVATDGTRTVSTVKETNKVSKNTANTIFTDYIKPEFTYSSITDTNIVHGTGRKVEIMFDVTDKYFESTTLSNLNASQITIGMDDYDETELNKAITKKLEKVGTITDTVNGVSNVTVGERYKLTITGLEQQNEKGLSDGYTYSGYMSLKFAKGTIKDKSGNLSDATTITIGKNEPGGSVTDKTVVDIVDPVWTLGDVDANDGTIKLRVKDKFLIKDRSKFELTTDKITIYADDVVSTEIEKQISDPVEIRANEEYEYTLTLLNIKPDGDEYEEFTPKNPIVGGTAKYKKENGGDIKIKIAAGAVTDAYGNKTKEQIIDPGNIDGTGPEVYDIQKTKDATNNKETFVFNVTDKNYDSTDLVTIDELTVWLDGKQVDIDGEITKKFITNPVAKIGTPVEIITTVNGQERVVGHQYTLEIGSIVETNAEFVASNRKYRELSGTLEIKIATDAAKDKKGNKINPDTATITDFNDMIKPEVIYKYATSNIDKTNKIFKMEFDLVDKYCKTINNIAVTDLTIQIDGKVPDWTKVTRNLEVSDIKEPVNGTNKLIGRHYTLTLSNLEQLQVKSGDNYLDYSGVITVAIPANKMQDTTGNQNVTTTITSGVSIPAGTGSDTIVDVVDPLIEKISSTVDAPTKTATLNFKVTDKYFASSDLANGNIEILVNGAKNTTVAANNALTVVKNLTEPRTVDGKTVQVQYGIEYSLKISGFDANANQIKVRFPANLVKDKAVEGKQNGNKQTDIMIYNVLRSAATETEVTNPFLGNTKVLRQNVDNVTFMSNIPDSVMDKTKNTFKNTNAWDVSAMQDKSIIAWYNSNEVKNGTYKVYIGSDTEIFGNTDSTNLFRNVGHSDKSTSTETITNISLLNTGSVTNMSWMFGFTGYNKMTKLELGDNFDTKNVTNMEAMFGETGRIAMTKLDLGTKFNTSNVTNMGAMFSNAGMQAMTTFNLGSNFNTGKVLYMQYMFNCTGYEKLITLNLGSNFDTSNVTNMYKMFYKTGYKVMTSLDLGSKFNTSKVTDMSSMFEGTGYTAMETLNLGANFDTSKVTNMSNMFNSTGYAKMASLDLKAKFNTSKVTNMSGMFASTGHELMTTLDLGANFDTSSVTDMSSMFEATGYKKMTKLNLREKFNTSKVTNMSKMFKNAGFTAMTSLDLGNTFYTTVATDTSEMFNNTGATAMTILDLGPAFDRIPDTNTDMFKNTGTAALVVYAPESIYSNVTTFIANRTRN